MGPDAVSNYHCVSVAIWDGRVSLFPTVDGNGWIPNALHLECQQRDAAGGTHPLLFRPVEWHAYFGRRVWSGDTGTIRLRREREPIHSHKAVYDHDQYSNHDRFALAVRDGGDVLFAATGVCGVLCALHLYLKQRDLACRHNPLLFRPVKWHPNRARYIQSDYHGPNDGKHRQRHIRFHGL